MATKTSELNRALMVARTVPEILEALARVEYRRAHPGMDCPADMVPTLEGTGPLTEGEERAYRDGQRSTVATLRARLVEAGREGEFQVLLQHLDGWIQASVYPSREDVWELMEGEHLAWVGSRGNGVLDPHPLAHWMRRWQARGRDARRVDVEAVQAAGVPYTKAYRWGDVALAPLVPADVGAIMVDGEPFATRFAGSTAYRQGAGQRGGEQLALGFLPPATLKGDAVKDVVLAAASQLPLGGDERGTLRADMIQVVRFSHALTGLVRLTEEQGAVLVGGRVTAANIRRWNDAVRLVRSFLLIVNPDRGTPLPLAYVDWPEAGEAVIGPPTARGWQWRITSGLLRSLPSAKRGPDDAKAWLARTVAGLESSLFWSRSPGRGRGGRTALLLHRDGSALHGPPVDVPARTVLLAAGEHVPDGPLSKAAMNRYGRRVDALDANGYMTTGSRVAGAGDSVEIVDVKRGGGGHPAGIRIRASARFVEAAGVRGRKGVTERISVADLLRRRGGG